MVEKYDYRVLNLLNTIIRLITYLNSFEEY